MSTGIVIATSQKLIAEKLESIIESMDKVSLAGVAYTKAELEEQLVVKLPEILIIDRWFENMFKEENLEATNSLLEKYKTILFSDPDKEQIYKLHKMHIFSFFTLHASGNEVKETINNTLEGTKHFTPKVVEALIELSFSKAPEQKEQHLHDDLSEREMEVLMHLAQGKSTKEIAEALFLSPHTVYTHRKNILKKLSCKSAAEVINYAYSQGLVEKD